VRDHKRTQHLVFYICRAFVHTARPFPSFRDILLARTLSKFRISVNMYMFTHSLALSRSLTLSLSRYRWVDTDQSWTRTSRTTTSRTNRRRYLILCCNVKCNTKCLHFFLSLSKRALNAPGGVRPTSRRRGSNNILAAFLRVVLRFEREKYSSSSRRRKRRRQNHLALRGKISFRILFGRSKRCLQNASERRGIARDWSKWNTVEVLVDKGSFEGLCSVRLRVVCARFKQRRLVSLSLSLSLSLRV
jgi:hypothetical protein